MGRLGLMDAGARLRDSQHRELLQPYADQDGSVAGYRIEGLLSSDPWRHTTYEAIAPDGRPVALKLVPLRGGSGRREARTFRRRVRARAAIEHPHLLPILDWGRLDDRLYVAMALCKAPTLADLLHAGRVTTKGCLRLLGQLADALEAAHERGVTHGELAPENVLVGPAGGGHVLLGDFGVGSMGWAGGLLDLAEPTHYVAPEKLRDEPLTPASNVYSLACILVECLTGSPPFTSDVPGMVAYAHAAEPPPRLSARRSDLPVAIDDLVAAAMAKDPNERLESPRWLVAAVTASLGLESAPPADRSAAGAREPDASSANGTAAAGALAPQAQAVPAPQAPAARAPQAPSTHVPQDPAPRALRGRRLRLKRPLSAHRAFPPRLSALRRHAGAWAPPRPRNVVALTLAVAAAAAGTLGFTLGRSGGDGSQTAVDPTPLRAERERAAALRGTGEALERLGSRRARLRRRLASAGTSRTQAAAAGRLRSAHVATARAVPTNFFDTARIGSRLAEVGQAYGRLRAAARRGDRSDYAAARRVVRRREAELQRAIARLSRPRP